MSRVFDCADQASELPFFGIVPNAIIEHLLEAGFQATAHTSMVEQLSIFLLVEISEE